MHINWLLTIDFMKFFQVLSFKTVSDLFYYRIRDHSSVAQRLNVKATSIPV